MQKQANDQKQDGDGGAHHAWGRGKDFSMKGGKPSCRIYMSDLERAFTSRVERSAELFDCDRPRRVSAENDNFFRKNRDYGCADCYQHNRLLLMVSLVFHAKYKKFIATVGELRVPWAVSTVWAIIDTILSLDSFILLLLSIVYYITDNDINNVTDSEILRGNVEFRWKIIWIERWIGWLCVCVFFCLIHLIYGWIRNTIFERKCLDAKIMLITQNMIIITSITNFIFFFQF